MGFLGDNRTGKSSVARIYALMSIYAKQKQGKKYSVHGHDPQNRFKLKKDGGILDGKFYPSNWIDYCLQLTDALIIIDEMRMLNSKNVPEKKLDELFYNRAANNVDIIWVAHNPKLSINLFAFFTTHWVIFKMNVIEGSFEQKIPNWIQCKAASKKVNEYVSIYGKGKHPNSPEFMTQQTPGQKFPYCFVDNESDEVAAINMNKPI